jgi:2-oxoisovalerate dehydrogenase E1 component
MREMTFVDAAREGLAEEMAADPTIFVVGEGAGVRGGNFNTTLGLFDIHGPERLVDVPISERGFVGMCAGAAMTGTRPIVDFMFTDFILDSIGEMVNQAAKMQYMSSGRLKMPLVLRGCVGVGGSAATHHSGNYYPFFTHQPGFRVVYPSNPADAKGLFKTSIRSDDPVLFLEHRLLLATKGPVPEEDDFVIPFGQAKVVKAGTDITIVALAIMVGRTVAIAEKLQGEGISVEVIDPRTLAPLDMDTILESVAKTGRLMIIDETYAPGSIGADIAAAVVDVAFDDLDAPIRRLNGLHTPIPYSPPLEAAAVPQDDAIAAAIRALAVE